MPYQEGQTATNKETGRRYIFKNGKWEDLAPPPPAGRVAGSQLPKTVQGVLTTLQGPSANLADEIAGALAMRGAAEAQRGAGMAGIDLQRVDPASMYEPTRDVVRGATERFAETNPVAAFGLQAAGGLVTAPFGGFSSAAPLGATTLRTATQYLPSIIGQSALGAYGASEAETGEQLARDVALGTLTGTLTGGAGALGMAGVSNVAQRGIPALRKNFELAPARERLAMLLQRDLEARIPVDTLARQDRITALRQELSQQQGPTARRAEIEEELEGLQATEMADPTEVAAARLQRPRGGGLGPEAPIAATGAATRGELALLRNEPGATEGLIGRSVYPLVVRRGQRLQEAGDAILNARGVRFKATVDDLQAEARAKSRPFYDQLNNVGVTIDDDLYTLMTRGRDQFNDAERLANIEGTPVGLDLSALRPGDVVPFRVLDLLKRNLYDAEDKAKTPLGKATALSNGYTKLRRQLTDKLDDVSPTDNDGNSIYRLAREAFSTDTVLANAVQRGRTVMKEDIDDLEDIISDMEPAQLNAFRIGVAQGLRDKTDTPGGQTTLLNLPKSPGLQKRLRLVFGNDFKKYNAAILRERELQKVAQAGEGSQTYRLLKRGEEQNKFAEAVETAQALQGDMVGAVARIAARDKGRQLSDRERQRVAELLLLRGQPAQDELRNLRLYLDRRAAAQRLQQEAAGRIGAAGASFGTGQE